SLLLTCLPLFSLLSPRPPGSTLFPYTTLFRSGADEARERLFEHFVLAEAEELGNGVVGLEDLPFEIGDEDRVGGVLDEALGVGSDRKSTRLNSSHVSISYAVFCLKKKKTQ